MRKWIQSPKPGPGFENKSVWRKDGILLSLKYYLCPLRHPHGCSHLGKPWPWRLSGEEKSPPKEGVLWESGPQPASSQNSLVQGIALGALVDFILTLGSLTGGWVFVHAHSARGEGAPVGLMLAAKPDQMKLPSFCLNFSASHCLFLGMLWYHSAALCHRKLCVLASRNDGFLCHSSNVLMTKVPLWCLNCFAVFDWHNAALGSIQPHTHTGPQRA